MLFTRPAAGFSHVASNILVAGAGGTPFAESSLSGTPLDASTYPASMREVCRDALVDGMAIEPLAAAILCRQFGV